MKDPNNPCIFCSIRKNELIFENSLAYASRDSYPVTKFHSLVVPKITSATIITTKDCIPINGTVSDKIENGLVENIKFIKSLY